MEQKKFDELMSQAQAERDIGQLLSLSPTVGGYGQMLFKSGSGRLREGRKLQSEQASAAARDAEWERRLGLQSKQQMEEWDRREAARAEEWDRRQAQRQADALERQKQEREVPSISSSERKDIAETERVLGEADALLSNWVEGSVNPGVDVISNLFSDSVLSPFKTVIEGQFYTPAQQAQRVAAAQLEGTISKAMAGLNLTGFELEERKRWSPFTPGISDEQSKLRLKALREQFRKAANVKRGSVKLPELEMPAEPIVEPEPELPGPQPSGPAFMLRDGTVWQDYDDGSTRQVR